MKAINKTKKVTLNGIDYRTRFDIMTDELRYLPFHFVTFGIITDAEWAVSTTKIVDRFKLDLSINPIDGRSKEARKLPYFTWSILETLKLN